MKLVTIFSILHGRESSLRDFQISERLRHLPKIAQLTRGRTDIQIQNHCLHQANVMLRITCFPKPTTGRGAEQPRAMFLLGILRNKPYGPSSSYITASMLTRGSLTTTQKTDRIHNRPPYVLPFPDSSRTNSSSGAHRNFLDQNSFIPK